MLSGQLLTMGSSGISGSSGSSGNSGSSDSDFTAETEDGGYMIQGTANLGSDTENGIVRMSAEEEQTATVEGALNGKKGSIRLVYTRPPP